MNFKNVMQIFVPPIKILSIVFITSAILLELINIYAVLTNNKLPSSLNPIFWIDRFAMTSHLIEAVIAASYATSKNKIPIKYGTYTFFVGTIGLLELFKKKESIE